MKVLSLRRLNVVNPSAQQSDWDMVMQVVSMGLCYDEVYSWFEERGLYVPLDQYDQITQMLNTAMDLDIGKRQNEGYNHE